MVLIVYHFHQMSAIPRQVKVSCFNSFLLARRGCGTCSPSAYTDGEHVPQV